MSELESDAVNSEFQARARDSRLTGHSMGLDGRSTERIMARQNLDTET